MKFKVGDKVKLTGGGYGDAPTNPIWGGKYGNIWGKVTEYDYSVYVAWSNGKTNVYGVSDLELVDERYKPLDDLMKFIEEELVI
jgi:hypothetical protein